MIERQESGDSTFCGLGLIFEMLWLSAQAHPLHSTARCVRHVYRLSESLPRAFGSKSWMGRDNATCGAGGTVARAGVHLARAPADSAPTGDRRAHSGALSELCQKDRRHQQRHLRSADVRKQPRAATGNSLGHSVELRDQACGFSQWPWMRQCAGCRSQTLHLCFVRVACVQLCQVS